MWYLPFLLLTCMGIPGAATPLASECSWHFFTAVRACSLLPTMTPAAASLPHTLLYHLSQVLTSTPSSTPAPRILTDGNGGARQAPYNPALPHSRPCRRNSYLMTSLSPLLAPKSLLFLGLHLCGWPGRLETCGANHFQDSSCGSWVSHTPCLSPTRAVLLGGGKRVVPSLGPQVACLRHRSLLLAPSPSSICSMLLRGPP